MTEYTFDQPVTCYGCKKLLGFAPYFRREYMCIECNGQTKEEIETMRDGGFFK